MAKRGRPKNKSLTVYSPVDNTTILPYARKDAQGNYFFSWKDEQGRWRKKNLGRGEKWYQKYLQYEAQFITKEPNVVLPDIIPPILKDGEISDTVNVDEFEFTIGEDGVPNITSISPRFQQSVMIKWAKDLIHNDPKQASKLFEVPYERLIGLNQPKNYTLKEIGDAYFNREEFQDELNTSQKQELRKTRKTWDRFTKMVGVKTIKEIDKSHLIKYRDNVKKEARRNGWSSTWVKGYFERARRILNNAISEFNHPEDIIEVRRISLRLMKKPSNVVKYPPYRIKREEFHKILEYSSIEEKTMWLLSLNCAYYSIDVATVPITAFDRDSRAIVFRRSKTEGKGMGHRAAILWEETVEYLDKYLEMTKHRKRSTVFISFYGMPYVENRIRKRFNAVRKKAGLEHIWHSNFRDSFESVAYIVRGIQNSVDAVMGQQPEGSRGNYVDPELVPEIAKDACRVVHNYYFGEQKQK